MQTALIQQELPQPRQVSAIRYELPQGMNWKQQTFTRAELLRGKMLLLDETHPLPEDAPPPNTASVAKYGNGEIPVRSLKVKTGKEAMEALRILFAEMKERGMEGIYVWEGANTQQQQRKAMIADIRQLMKTHPPQTAVAMARKHYDLPRASELLQEYTVELRQMDSRTLQPLTCAPEDTPQGQTLLHLCWRYGFVRTSSEHPFRFRFVGKAHAAAMTFLDLELEEYLKWLQQKEQMLITAEGNAQYLILCRPLSGDYAALELPEGCAYEVSLDNMGYAIAACAL